MSEANSRMHSSEAILSVTDLVKTFTLHAVGGRQVTSLAGVSLTVGTGEHVAVAGASGAGKSSLLRCLYRSYLPDSGTVVLHTPSGAVELTALPDRQLARIRGRELGYVSQFLQAPPRVGPLELVIRAARRRGLPQAEAYQTAGEALNRLGIDKPLWDVDCSVLSGGERQRVNLAAGTVSPPRLLLLDEPVSALDPHNREKALLLIEDLRAQDVSVLAVYHDMKIIRRLASRLLVVENGRIVADGTPESVLAQQHSALADHLTDPLEHELEAAR
ncbi:alpha-D-ribose 1-methylphosphonate 5-triphosphate synthase subunit PhnL [Propionibacteriaceae bacterium ES.041]|nr:ATP-binding cassette domain-containing protein [Enemella evansiae]PFG65481.1 alpha-D-ribose 1-methylphosphonate 5-triphosphate synthase subunit PhnL [Propionibacteriaceae bacterium ES.041]TDO91614.1 alpha-D-ribose 1-methylphosphonate 5-triphosphate synthase subunit PhnL [Enemella evansiae]